MSDRRDLVPFDPHFFEKRQSHASLSDTFTYIHRTNHWSGPDSLSGAGASRKQTRVIEEALPRLLRDFDVEVLLDLPCGDFGWMQFVELPVSRYIGADIVPELIERNRALFGDAVRSFEVLDATSDSLPRADLMLCRDAMVHLSFADIFALLRNVCDGEIGNLLTTTFTECVENEDITTGDWRPLNLELPPFCFPSPIRLIIEGCTEGGGVYRDKSLALWRVEELRGTLDGKRRFQ